MQSRKSPQGRTQPPGSSTSTPVDDTLRVQDQGKDFFFTGAPLTVTEAYASMVQHRDRTRNAVSTDISDISGKMSTVRDFKDKDLAGLVGFVDERQASGVVSGDYSQRNRESLLPYTNMF